MEHITEHISIRLFQEEVDASTACFIKQEGKYISLYFELSQKDDNDKLSPINGKLEVLIRKDYFKKYLSSYVISTGKKSICCNTEQKVTDIMNCALGGLARKMFIESSILYILIQLEVSSLSFKPSCENCSFMKMPLDLDKIKEAQEFILKHLDQNITIPIIANRIGTNQCYLKKCFKEAVGKTIFEFVQENRMSRAKYLLANTNQSISEISQSVGYASISSFSQAYKNYYGSSPSLRLTLKDK